MSDCIDKLEKEIEALKKECHRLKQEHEHLIQAIQEKDEFTVHH